MSTIDANSPPSRGAARKWILPVVAVVVIGVIALDTTVVQIGSDLDVREQAFDPDAFGAAEFPRIAEYVTGRAGEAVALSSLIASDKEAAVAAHGTEVSIGPVMAVSFTGTVGEGRSGVHDMAIAGLDGVRVRVQFGPAVNGTDLRDVPGDIVFGDFTNQIEYQDAGAGLNRAMAAKVYEGLDRDSLVGRTVEVTGVFKMISPANWLVTPVALEVQ